MAYELREMRLRKSGNAFISYHNFCEKNINKRSLLTMNISLLTPTTDLQEEYLDFYNEWKDSGEAMIPFVISKILLISRQ